MLRLGVSQRDPTSSRKAKRIGLLGLLWVLIVTEIIVVISAVQDRIAWNYWRDDFLIKHALPIIVLAVAIRRVYEWGLKYR